MELGEINLFVVPRSVVADEKMDVRVLVFQMCDDIFFAELCFQGLGGPPPLATGGAWTMWVGFSTFVPWLESESSLSSSSSESSSFER